MPEDSMPEDGAQSLQVQREESVAEYVDRDTAFFRLLVGPPGDLQSFLHVEPSTLEDVPDFADSLRAFSQMTGLQNKQMSAHAGIGGTTFFSHTINKGGRVLTGDPAGRTHAYSDATYPLMTPNKLFGLARSLDDATLRGFGFELEDEARILARGGRIGILLYDNGTGDLVLRNYGDNNSDERVRHSQEHLFGGIGRTNNTKNLARILKDRFRYLKEHGLYGQPFNPTIPEDKILTTGGGGELSEKDLKMGPNTKLGPFLRKAPPVLGVTPVYMAVRSIYGCVYCDEGKEAILAHMGRTYGHTQS